MAIRPLYNEKEILSKIASGDTRAFTCLFDTYYKHLGQYVYRVTESIEAAEEIVQEVFVKIWSKREELTTIENFSSYLFIITRNRTFRFLKHKAVSHLKKQEWEKQYKEDFELSEVITADDDFRLFVEELIAKLPPQQKKVYEMSRIDNLKHAEIGVILNISPETVKKHIMSANKFIKNSIIQKKDLIYLLFLIFTFHFKK